jgi:hypothetical protein
LIARESRESILSSPLDPTALFRATISMNSDPNKCEGRGNPEKRHHKQKEMKGKRNLGEKFELFEKFKKRRKLI